MPLAIQNHAVAAPELVAGCVTVQVHRQMPDSSIVWAAAEWSFLLSRGVSPLRTAKTFLARSNSAVTMPITFAFRSADEQPGVRYRLES